MSSVTVLCIGFIAAVFLGSAVLSAQAVSETTSGVTTIPQLDMLKWQLVLSALATFAIQHLKRAPWFTWMNMQTEGVNRVAGIVTSFFAAVGVGWTFDAETGTLIITGLTVAGIWGFAQEWLTQWIMQQLVYKGAVAPHSSAKNVERVIGTGTGDGKIDSKPPMMEARNL